jgi:hypothetical protein
VCAARPGVREIVAEVNAQVPCVRGVGHWDGVDGMRGLTYDSSGVRFAFVRLGKQGHVPVDEDTPPFFGFLVCSYRYIAGADIAV